MVRTEEEEELMLYFGIEASFEMDTKSVCHLGLRTLGTCVMGSHYIFFNACLLSKVHFQFKNVVGREQQESNWLPRLKPKI